MPGPGLRLSSRIGLVVEGPAFTCKTWRDTVQRLTPNPDHLSMSLNLASESRTVTVVPDSALLASISATPDATHPGETITLTATLSAPAPAGGIRVALLSSAAGVVMPEDVLVPAGAVEASVHATMPNGFSQTSVMIFALLGLAEQFTTITVSP
jgi:hypothetical protein